MAETVGNTVESMFKDSSKYSLTDPNKPTPTIGQQLTLGQLHDVEFMRSVRCIEVKRDGDTFSTTGNTYHAHEGYLSLDGDSVAYYAITHADVGWSVTVADVVEEG